jgi:hypothetical protein
MADASLAKRVLSVGKRHFDARITGLAQDETSATLVRLSGTPSTVVGHGTCVDELRASWPLAHTSCIENALSGERTVQILFPADGTVREMAAAIALRSPIANAMRTTILVLAVIGAISFVVDVAVFF